MASKAGMSQDQFANRFFGYAAESVAGTIAFKEIPTQVDTFSKEAWVLHRLEWFIAPTYLDLIIAASDAIQFGLSSSDKVTVLYPDQSAMVTYGEIDYHFATAVGFNLLQLPFIQDFTALPGGGIIIAPRPLYVAVRGNSLANVVRADVRGWFSRLTLNADQYLELVDFYRIVQ